MNVIEALKLSKEEAVDNNGDPDNFEQYNNFYGPWYYSKSTDRAISYIKDRKLALTNEELLADDYEFHSYAKTGNNSPINIKRRRRRRSDNKKKMVDTLTNAQWLECLNFFDTSCAYCQIKLGEDVWEPIHKEHMIPISRNGENTIANVIPSCGDCNTTKSTKTVEEWYDRRKEDLPIRLKQWLQLVGNM